MSDADAPPPDRFVFRPDIDPNDSAAVTQLAHDIAAWVLAHRERVQRQTRG